MGGIFFLETTGAVRPCGMGSGMTCAARPFIMGSSGAVLAMSLPGRSVTTRRAVAITFPPRRAEMASGGPGSGTKRIAGERLSFLRVGTLQKRVDLLFQKYHVIRYLLNFGVQILFGLQFSHLNLLKVYGGGNCRVLYLLFDLV